MAIIFCVFHALSVAVVLKLQCESESPGELVKTQDLDFTWCVSESTDLRCHLNLHSTNKSPGMLLVQGLNSEDH